MSPTTETSSPMTAIVDTWPRFADWLESRVPSDLSWRAGLMHGVRVEEYTEDGNFVIRAELPGMDPEKDIEITCANDLLTIEGRRHAEHKSEHRSEFFYGKFSRTLSLPTGSDPEHIEACYENGILEVKLPVEGESGHARRIEITHH